ncbi:hypothetical protein ACNKHW_05150 [Shigella flexneri]
MFIAGLIVNLVPVVICFRPVLCIANEPRPVVRATTGARTCAPAMEIISDTARNNIPALGYAGTMQLPTSC